tara:strand:- start:196 stop:384 length:189 start_codon:yes stop_codon:yes gene_type:complete
LSKDEAFWMSRQSEAVSPLRSAPALQIALLNTLCLGAFLGWLLGQAAYGARSFALVTALNRP